MAEEFKAFRVKITGRVQGVAFRAWTESEAAHLGLDGWVRNEPDGSVAALIAGPASKVSRMIELLWRGPRLAKVTDVQTVPAEFHAQGDGFRIEY
jgi:acylphosphatase